MIIYIALYLEIEISFYMLEGLKVSSFLLLLSGFDEIQNENKCFRCCAAQLWILLLSKHNYVFSDFQI